MRLKNKYPLYTPLERCKQIANRISNFDKSYVISDLCVINDLSVETCVVTKEKKINDNVNIKAIYMLDSAKNHHELFFTLMPQEYANSEEILNTIKGILSLSSDIAPFEH